MTNSVRLFAGLARALGALAIGATVAAADPAPVPAAPSAPSAAPSFATWTLANGLTVAHVEQPGSPAVSVQLWVRAGAIEDPAGKRGLARLFEHLAFAGSKRVRPGDHVAFVESVGGNASALVNEDAATFVDTVPATRLDLALDLAVERLRGLELRPSSVAEAIARAQAALGQKAQSPLWRIYRRLVAASFVQHPYGQAVAASPAELEAITAADVRAFYQAFYQPGNALVVVVGGVGEATARAAVDARFGPLPAAPAPVRRAAELPEPPQSARRREEVAGADGLVALGFHIPAAREPDVYALQLLGQVLAGGKGARVGRLVAAGTLTDVGGQVVVRHDPGLLLLYAAAAPGHTTDEVEAAIGAALRGLATAGPSAAELARAKKQVAATVLGGADGATGLGNQIGVAWTLTERPALAAGELAAVGGLTVADLRRAARSYLREDRATVVVGRPAGGAR